MERIFVLPDIVDIKVVTESNVMKVYGQAPDTDGWFELHEVTPKEISSNCCKHCGGSNVRKETFGKRMYCTDCRGFYE